MSGFRNISEWCDAYEAGQTWSVVIRKSSTPNINDSTRYVDWMYLGGTPSANYYASSPLVAAIPDTGLRPYLPSVSPAKQFIKTLEVTPYTYSAAMAGATNNWILADYLLYYPFVDFTAVGEVQTMTNDVALARYSDGAGVKMMLVGQSAAVGGGQMTITYINQSGVQKTTPTFYIGLSSYSGQIVNTTTSGSTSISPYIPLAAGDSGVRSVVSATSTVDGGGIGAIVLVKPLHRDFNSESSWRVTASGYAYGAFAQTEFVLQKPPIQIIDGAHLGIFGTPTAGGDTRYAAMLLRIETVWN